MWQSSSGVTVGNTGWAWTGAKPIRTNPTDEVLKVVPISMASLAVWNGLLIAAVTAQVSSTIYPTLNKRSHALFYFDSASQDFKIFGHPSVWWTTKPDWAKPPAITVLENDLYIIYPDRTDGNLIKVAKYTDPSDLANKWNDLGSVSGVKTTYPVAVCVYQQRLYLSFYKDDGTIWLTWRDGNLWIYPVKVPTEGAYTSPSLFVDDGLLNIMYSSGKDNYLRRISYSGNAFGPNEYCFSDATRVVNIQSTVRFDGALQTFGASVTLQSRAANRAFTIAQRVNKDHLVVGIWGPKAPSKADYTRLAQVPAVTGDLQQVWDFQEEASGWKIENSRSKLVLTLKEPNGGDLDVIEAKDEGKPWQRWNVVQTGPSTPTDIAWAITSRHNGNALDGQKPDPTPETNKEKLPAGRSIYNVILTHSKPKPDKESQQWLLDPAK